MFRLAKASTTRLPLLATTAAVAVAAAALYGAVILVFLVCQALGLYAGAKA